MIKLAAKTEQFLKSHGVEYFAGFRISPMTFWIISVFSGFFGWIFGKSFGVKNIIFSWMIFLLGTFIPTVLLYISNESDNDKMLKDIKNLFEMLKIQIHSGVYMVEALENCCQELENKRLLKALNRLLNEIYMSKDIVESLKDFNASFSNPHIDMLTVILRQSMETGYSVNYLDSAFEQVLDVEQAIHIKMEQAVERNVQIMQVLFMAGIIAMSVYCSIVEFKGLFEIF